MYHKGAARMRFWCYPTTCQKQCKTKGLMLDVMVSLVAELNRTCPKERPFLLLPCLCRGLGDPTTAYSVTVLSNLRSPGLAQSPMGGSKSPYGHWTFLLILSFGTPQFQLIFWKLPWEPPNRSLGRTPPSAAGLVLLAGRRAPRFSIRTPRPLSTTSGS